MHWFFSLNIYGPGCESYDIVMAADRDEQKWNWIDFEGLGWLDSESKNSR